MTTLAEALDVARRLTLEKRHADARYVYERILDSDPGNADALNGLGHVSLASGEAGRAVDHFARAAEAQPGNAAHRSGLAAAHRALARAAAEAGRAASARPPARRASRDEVTWVKREALLDAPHALVDWVPVALDIGPGIRPQTLIEPEVHICCEPFGPYAEKLQATYDRSARLVVLQATWQQAVEIVAPASVDSVFMLDIIEHLEKEEGARLLEATVRLARHQVVIFTPLGFVQQYHPDGKDAWGMDGASWQEHKSGWMPSDFGTEWQIVASPDFITTDNLGRPLATPAGAFWAIRTA